jgi:S-DNA-T family DNA segregation ATPase FtsK/SpoIIIE
MNYVAQKLIDTLDSFGVGAQIVGICRGPSVTRYEIEPDVGIKISKVTRLADDIALRLAATGVRIAAIPNKPALGIEVPNRSRQTVGMRACIDSDDFRRSKNKLNVALGMDIAGNTVFCDISKMPHMLIAGTTGSGKSVCLNTMIISILYNSSPDEVKMVMIDPKQVEFKIYNGIPHLEVPVVSNPRKAAGALGWAVKEMESRYQKFSENNVRDIKGYNELADKKDGMVKMHQVVIFIDELADLMMVAPTEVEDSICRLAQMARAAGMHLVIATQRPSTNVITGVIKANIPSRIALSVSSGIDSRVILDTSGAEKLLGNGDMLFMPVGESKAKRLQGCFISDSEVESVVEFIKQNSQAEYNDDVIQQIDSIAAASEAGKKKGSSVTLETEDDGNGPSDDVIKALEALIKAGKASTTFLQNKLGWGYPKAARIMNELEECGYIAPKEGNKERRVLITLQQLYEMSSSNEGIHAPVDSSILEEEFEEIDGFESSDELDADENDDEEEAVFEDYDSLLGYDEEESSSDENQDEIDFDFIPFDDSED